jgi:geranylgeranyl diphosphate synthase type II
MYKQKTGCLLVAAAKIGCILAGGTIDDQNNATVFGENLGLAFQIIDDILDTTADEKILGKPIGSDADSNKSTYVTILGIDKSKEYAEALTKSIGASATVSGSKVTVIFADPVDSFVVAKLTAQVRVSSVKVYA